MTRKSRRELERELDGLKPGDDPEITGFEFNINWVDDPDLDGIEADVEVVEDA